MTLELVLLNSSTLDYLSVSFPMVFLGISWDQTIFTSSINWRNPRPPNDQGSLGFDHGWLDDTVLIGIGLADTKLSMVEALGADLLKEHVQCSKIMD